MTRAAKDALHVGLLALWAACVASLTLRTVDVVAAEPAMSSFCLLCGDRGLADAVLNLVLFLPLGAVLAATGRVGLLWSGVAGISISLLIEFGQALIPGRYPTAGDVAWNGAGALTGALLWQWLSARRRAAPARDRGGAAAMAAGLTVIVSGVLLSPHPTESDYWGQWTPDLGIMPQYKGRVVAAFLADRPLPSGRLDSDPPPRSQLSGPWRIHSTITVGPPPPAVSPIVSIYDREEREILLLGADGDDVVLRERTLAKTFRLDQPDLRVEALFEPLSPGDEVALDARREGEGRCIRVGDAERCGLGFTPGRGWGILYFPDGIDEGARRALDFAWIALLFLPVGLLSTSTRLAVLSGGGGAAAAFGLAVAFTRLTPAPVAEYVAAALGLVVGLLAARFAGAGFESEDQVGEASSSASIA